MRPDVVVDVDDNEQASCVTTRGGGAGVGGCVPVHVMLLTACAGRLTWSGTQGYRRVVLFHEGKIIQGIIHVIGKW
jgi:hypothetical protein